MGYATLPFNLPCTRDRAHVNNDRKAPLPSYNYNYPSILAPPELSGTKIPPKNGPYVPSRNAKTEW
jgi:hypothetical protein